MKLTSILLGYQIIKSYQESMLLSLLNKTDYATLLYNNMLDNLHYASRENICMHIYVRYMHIYAYDVDQIKLMDDEIGLLDTPMLNISRRLS